MLTNEKNHEKIKWTWFKNNHTGIFRNNPQKIPV